MVKRVWKKIRPINLRDERQCARWLAIAEKYQKWRRKLVYHLSVESAKNWILVYNFANIFRFFLLVYLFLAILGLSGAYWGPLRAMALLWGPPRSPMSSLTSIATLTPGLVQLPVQLGKFTDFWVAKTKAPKPKLMEVGTRAKMKKSVKVFVS